jgi:hypothetical protein
MFCMFESVPPAAVPALTFRALLTVKTWVDIRNIDAHCNP